LTNALAPETAYLQFRKFGRWCPAQAKIILSLSKEGLCYSDGRHPAWNRPSTSPRVEPSEWARSNAQSNPRPSARDAGWTAFRATPPFWMMPEGTALGCATRCVI